ncbi:TPA: hypothetical protein DD712_01015 [Candidatus Acetothermia bacterium]|nr:hypothetical protein [Candidatus Acetothermia bacterium]
MKKIFEAQLLTYMRATKKKVGLLKFQCRKVKGWDKKIGLIRGHRGRELRVKS